jgi:septum formation topological specificity factor MinE
MRCIDDSTNHASYDCLQKDIAYVIHQYIASASDLMHSQVLGDNNNNHGRLSAA